MQKFAGLLDKLIILSCCLVIYFTQNEFAVNVAIILTVIIVSGFLSYFDQEILKTTLKCGYVILAWLYPALVIFLPLIAYDMVLQQYQHSNLLALVPLISFLNSASGQLIAASLAVLLLSIVIRLRMALLTGLQTKYRKLSDASREMALQLQQQNKDLIEKQDNELNLATLNERNRIAREIHDNVGHLLSSAILQAGALRTINRDEKVELHLEALHTTLAQAMDSTRDSVHKLYDESIDLRAQVEALVKQFSFCELSYEYSFVNDPGLKLKYALIAIVKEALSNLIKHSNASRASLIFREHPALYQLIIRDNGSVTNYDPDGGMGLKNMIDRVHSFNGHLNIMTEAGFEIFISVPKEDLH